MASSPKHWSSRFPVYQIDFAAAASGKRVAATKRRIRWRFGFPNKGALAEGQSGTDCRGEEHDVTVVWSLTSGKRQISMDGKEIHYSSNRAGLLDFSWTARGNHVIKVICHAAPPLSATPGFRQYDLLIDGQSFFTMPKVYELGIKGPIPSHARVPGYPSGSSGYSNPTSPISFGSGSQGRSLDYSAGIAPPSSREQEEHDLRKAIQASIEESRRHLDTRRSDDNTSSYSVPTPQANAGTANLLDFDAPAPGHSPAMQPPADARSVSSMPSYYSAPPSYNQGAPTQSPAHYQSPPPIQQANPVASPAYPAVAPGALVLAQAPPGYYGAPPPGQYGAPPPAQYGAPPPAHYASPPPAAPAYASPPPAAPAYASPQPTTPAYGAPPPTTPSYASPPPAYASPPPGQAPSPQYAAYQQPTDTFGLGSSPEHDPFAPQPPPPPPRQDFASAILGAYSSGASAGAPQQNGTSPQHPPQTNGHSPSPQAHSTPVSMNALVDTQEEPENEFDAAMKKLVNVDRIDEPASAHLKLTMIREAEGKKIVKGKSRPIPPAAHGMIGGNATLQQIKSVHPDGPPKYNAEGNVMRAPPPGAFQQGSGAMVVHGQGPPSLQQPMGFGVGASMPNGGFNSQQAPAYQRGLQQPQYR